MCLAQGTTSVLGTDSIVTGACYGHEQEPGCVIPSLFGSNGLTLFPNVNPSFSHYAHFTGQAQDTLNTTLTTAIATQLAILPIISPGSGYTFRYDSASGAFVPTSSSFGPIYTERGQTIGRGRFSFGVSYQRFRFNSLDGIDLHKVPAVFAHIPDTGPGEVPEPYEADVISTENSLNVNMDQTMFYGTVGVTDRLDISLAIPLVSIRIGGDSNANIIRVSGPTFIPTGAPPGTPPINNPHAFDVQGSLQKVFPASGSATGIGDITVRVKGGVFRNDKVQVALAMDVRAPSGDARKLLGSGAVGIKPFLAVSTGKRLSAHFNIGYQWNGKSILAGNITGTVFGENSAGQATITNGPVTKESLPNQFFYSVGVDYGATSRLTLVFDYLGQTVFSAPRVFMDSVTTQDVPGGTGALTLPTIRGAKDTFSLNNGAAGVKFNLFGSVLLTANLLFRMDNNGLRQDVTPLIGLAYTFGK